MVKIEELKSKLRYILKFYHCEIMTKDSLRAMVKSIGKELEYSDWTGKQVVLIAYDDGYVDIQAIYEDQYIKINEYKNIYFITSYYQENYIRTTPRNIQIEFSLNN